MSWSPTPEHDTASTVRVGGHIDRRPLVRHTAELDKMRFLPAVMCLSAVGVLACVAVLSTSFLLSLPKLPEGMLCLLPMVLGALVVWLPAVVLMQKMLSGAPKKWWGSFSWRRVLRGCPSWMRIAFQVLFHLFWLVAVWQFATPFLPWASPETIGAGIWRMFSAVGCCFYMAAFVGDGQDVARSLDR